MNEHPVDWSAIADAHEQLLSHPHLEAGFVRFRQDLARAYARVTAAIREVGAVASVPLDGAPILPLGPAQVPLDRSLVESLFRDVRTSLAAHGAEGAEVQRLAEAVEEEPDLTLRVLRWAVFDWDGPEIKEVARRLEVPYVGLLLLGRLLAAPFLHEVARGVVSDLPDASESTGTCPCCGAPPGLARLTASEGSRVLACTLCGTRWAYPRLKCAFCGNTDQDTLAVLLAEDEKAHRIEVCETCKRYLKTVDERVLGGECMPFLEETRTLPLDLLAEREGYVRRLY